MSDLGSKAALNSDIDAKVTTNGANENTGARVNDCLNNIVDTLYGSGSAPTATFSTTTNTAQDPGQDTVRFNSGTIGSVTEIALSDVVGGVDKGTLNSLCSGIIQFRLIGTTETIEFRITGVVHTSWTRYTVTYLKGSIPANGTVMAVRFLPVNVVTQTITNGETTTSPSEDAVFDALAGKADAVDVPTVYECVASGTAVTYAVNQFGNTFTIGNSALGVYSITADSGTPFTAGKVFVTAQPMDGLMPGIGVHGTWFPNSTTIIDFGFTDKSGNPIDPEAYSLYVRVYQ